MSDFEYISKLIFELRQILVFRSRFEAWLRAGHFEDPLDSLMINWRTAILNADKISESTNCKSIFKNQGDGTWMFMLANLASAIDAIELQFRAVEYWLKDPPECSEKRHPSEKNFRRSRIDGRNKFFNELDFELNPQIREMFSLSIQYLKLVCESCRNKLPEKERQEYLLRFDSKTGIVQIGAVSKSLDLRTQEYYWFWFLFESPDYAPYSEAKKRFPDLIDNSTRISKKIKDLIAHDIIETSENKVRGVRINPKYERV